MHEITHCILRGAVAFDAIPRMTATVDGGISKKTGGLMPHSREETSRGKTELCFQDDRNASGLTVKYLRSEDSFSAGGIVIGLWLFRINSAIFKL